MAPPIRRRPAPGPLPAGALLAAILLGAPAARAQGAPPGLAPLEHPALTLTDTSEPAYLKWNEGEVIPLGYHPVPRIRSGLVVGGALLIGTAWVPIAVVGPLAGVPLGAVPLAGPFIAAAGISSNSNANTLSGPAMEGWLVFDGLQQVAGLAMVIVGTTATRTVLARGSTPAARTWWAPVPLSFGVRSAGLGIAGTL